MGICFLCVCNFYRFTKSIFHTLTKFSIKAKPGKSLIFLEQKVINKIYLIRNSKVMLDFDLVEIYGVETGQLKRQAKRNPERFPKDFMFVLTKREFENLRSHIGISS